MLAGLTSGCHHKTQVSRRYPPAPPAARGTGGSDTARRTPYAVPLPLGPVDDNAIVSGRLASTQIGLASWYGPPYANHAGANGQIYDQNAMTAAHRTLPMGTLVQVTNLSTNQAVTVRITDRGPFVHGRVLDLSLAAAKASGLYRMGVGQVRIDVVEARAGDLSGGRWCVQIGAFLDRNNAYRLRSDLQRRYAPNAKVIEFEGPTGHWVRINPISADRTRAAQIAQAVRTAEPDALAYVVRLD